MTRMALVLGTALTILVAGGAVEAQHQCPDGRGAMVYTNIPCGPQASAGPSDAEIAAALEAARRVRLEDAHFKLRCSTQALTKAGAAPPDRKSTRASMVAELGDRCGTLMADELKLR